MISFFPLGGALEIGANSYFLDLFGTGIILDCGQHPQKTGFASLPDFSLLKGKPVDFVIISHAHQDHINSLPFLIKEFPYLQIIMTPQTRDIAELTLHNALNIMREQVGEQAAKLLFTHEELDLLTESIIALPYGKPYHLAGHKHRINEDIVVILYDAGHILGSSMIFLECSGKRLLYTGDINPENQSYLKGMELNGLKADILIMESTYGATPDTSITPWKDETLRLGRELNKVFNKGGSVLMPVFSLGKLQESLSVLYKLVLKGKIPRVPIYINGIGMKINRLYDRHRYLINVNDTEFQVTQTGYTNYQKVESPEDLFKESCIVLVSSGMMTEGTLSHSLAPWFLRDKPSAIFTSGYMDLTSPGYTIANAETGQYIPWGFTNTNLLVKCGIKNFRFSAHSSAKGLIQTAASINPEKIILVHGDEGAIDLLGQRLLKKMPHVKLTAAQMGKTILL